MVPVRYFAPIPPGDAGTLGYTVPWMHRLIKEGARDPGVRAKAREFEMSDDPVNTAFRFVQGLPYRHDPPEYEMLQGAPWLLRRSQRGLGYSDCDCRVILLGSLLESMGYRTRLVLIRAPGKDSFSHVYQEVWKGGRWVPLDTIFPTFRVGDEVRDRTGTKTVVQKNAALGGAWEIPAAELLLRETQKRWGLIEKLPHYQEAIELTAERFGPLVPGLEKVPTVTAAIPIAGQVVRGLALGAAILIGVALLRRKKKR